MDYDSSSDSSDDDDDDSLFWMATMAGRSLLEEEKEPKLRSLLSLQAQRNRSGKIRRGALHDYNQSAFKKVLDSGQDDAMIAVTGYDYASFNKLLIPFMCCPSARVKSSLLRVLLGLSYVASELEGYGSSS